jgi:HSP20 family molecular chaperone IbpA
MTLTEDSMDMFEQMDDMFARLFSRMDREFSAGTPQDYGYRFVLRNGGTPDRMAEIPAILPRATREPVAEVHQIGNETKVITELPGATDDMIRLEIKGSTLVVDTGDADHYYHTTASLPLVDAGSMQRSFKNGVLEVTFRNFPDTRDRTDTGKN